MTEGYSIRPIQAKDNAEVEYVVKTVLKEYGGDRPGTAYHDPSLKDMHAHYSAPQSAYLVIEHAGTIVGGGGISPLDGNVEDTCEFQKMYILKAHRGKGLGGFIIEKSLEFAKQAGFKHCYIETFGHMQAAQNLYKKHGFDYIDGALGSTGHSACDIQMMRLL